MADDWEKRYQAGDMPWEKGAPSPGLVEYLHHNPPLLGKILVPGCGFGHDVRAIAREDNEVIGTDIAPSAIQRAEAFRKAHRERYLIANLFDLPAELRGGFNWVWEHTLFCAIDPAMRPQYVQSAAAALKPEGHLLAVFYLDPGNEEEGPPFGTSLGELDALFGGAFVLEREWMPGSTYTGREGREWMRLLKKKP